ncbi:YwqG family protein [Amycolatopsis sp. NPDC006125]|uniref:YwqG family protein n=1 Tax=Amycolatopsis sp. NPDC006125 TaxID=3156730 RepID=UPI0033B3ACBB
MSDFAELRETHRRKVRAAGLGEFADELVVASLPSVRLLPARGPHRTRLGGDPELPPATPWPRAGHTPLSFVAQLDLSEMAPYDAEGILPADGLLSFFYDAIHQPWGFDPAHRDSATVLFTPGDAEVETRQAPSDLPANGRFSPVPLRPQADWTFVPWESAIADSLGMTRRTFIDEKPVIRRSFYWVRHEDLLARAWDRSWLVLQCA